MSLLALNSRPWTVFDPANKNHRRWYWEFVQSGTWGRCPHRFIVPDDQGDLITMIQRSLVKHYVNKEFIKANQSPAITKTKKKSKA
jgi:hypothetical protein